MIVHRHCDFHHPRVIVLAYYSIVSPLLSSALNPITVQAHGKPPCRVDIIDRSGDSGANGGELGKHSYVFRARRAFPFHPGRAQAVCGYASATGYGSNGRGRPRFEKKKKKIKEKCYNVARAERAAAARARHTRVFHFSANVARTEGLADRTGGKRTIKTVAPWGEVSSKVWTSTRYPECL